MAKIDLSDQGVLRQLIEYRPETGEMLWLERCSKLVALYGSPYGSKKPPEWLARRWNRGFAGRPAGGMDKNTGYLRISAFGVHQYSHRVAWVYMNGRIPKGMEVDHINGIGSDNRLANLRLVSSSANSKNMKRQSRNSSGATGVRWNPDRNKWIATIFSLGKFYHLGCFDNFDEAALARKSGEELHGFHPNHGRE